MEVVPFTLLWIRFTQRNLHKWKRVNVEIYEYVMAAAVQHGTLYVTKKLTLK